MVAQGVQLMHFLVPTYLTYIGIEVFASALRGCGDVKVPTLITVFGVCVLRMVWVLVLVPMHHTVIMVEASYPVTWLTASVLFAAYYLKGNWLPRCIEARQAAEQEG